MAPWYGEIGRQARSSAYLHADETGWRVDGRTWWLWCFCNEWNCYYMIDRSRGSPALHKFFTETFEGVLITDFWQAYWSVDVRDRQFCLPHLLRDMVGVDQHSQSACWPAFSKKLRRLLRDGMRLAARRREFEPEDYRRHCTQLDTRLMAIATADYIDAETPSVWASECSGTVITYLRSSIMSTWLRTTISVNGKFDRRSSSEKTANRIDPKRVRPRNRS